MTDISVKLSAYLDGELDEDEARLIEAQLADDPLLQQELDELVEANSIALLSFENMLHEPIELSVAQSIKTADETDAIPDFEADVTANERKVIDGVFDQPSVKRQRDADQQQLAVRSPLWRSMAASLILFLLGGAGGYTLHKEMFAGGAPVEIAAVEKRGWLKEIADYHAVYSTEERHLVEVRGDKKEHLTNWLVKKTGASFQVPDLSGLGYVFEGGRLLVADGRPVAQLIYRDKDATVVALCIQKMPAGMFSDKSKDQIGAADMKKNTIKDFDFFSWASGAVHYVVVGPNGKTELEKIALEAARHI